MGFSSFDLRAPSEPPYTCPQIDDVLRRMEELRTANDELRVRGDWWRERCQELCAQVEELENDLDAARAERDDLSNDLKNTLALADGSTSR
jgi:uncharacterized coiled-coil DUF342 family protein